MTDQEAPSTSESLDSWGLVTRSNYSESTQRTQMYKKPLVEMAVLVRDLVAKFNLNRPKKLPLFLNDGSLLGAYRNGRIIPHDYDLDFGVYGCLDDLTQLHEFLLGRLDLTRYILILSREDPGEKIELCDRTFGSYDAPSGKGVWYNVAVDLQLFSDRVGKEKEIEPRYFRDDLYKKITHAMDELLPLTKIEFEGAQFAAPANVQKFLINNYGCIEAGAVFNSVTGKYEKRN